VFEQFVDLETTGLVTSTEHRAAPRQQARDAAYPNPFRERVTLRFDFADGDLHTSSLAIYVYDLLGRRVRRLQATATPAVQTIEATWDGRNDAGHEVAAGVYLVRLEGTRTVRTQRVTHMR
jgi:hypothetical protein